MTLSLSQMEEARRALDVPLFADLSGDAQVSFEFFPPKTEKMAQQLWASVETLAPLAKAARLSVTTIFGGVSQGKQVSALGRHRRATSAPAV